jgi:ubiquinone/menaquinone biosynthesis C-methylase UbiE
MIYGQVRSIHAVDFSGAMIDLFNQYIEKSQIKNIQTCVADGQNLPFSENTFDRAFSMFGLIFFPDRLKGFSEMFRVLKPGGLALVSSWAPVDQSPAMQMMFGALRAAKPDLPEPKKNIMNLENPDIFRDELKQSGFENIQIIPMREYLEAASVAEFWEQMVLGSAPVVMLKKQVGDQKWAELESLSLEYFRREIKQVPVALSSDAWLGVGSKPDRGRFEFDMPNWEQQIAQDARLGKFDQLASEAIRDHQSGKSIYEKILFPIRQ